MTNNINKSKIVILGSTGFVGTWLSLYFEKKRYNYLGIGLKENKNKFHNKIKKNINYKYLDIQNFKKLSDILDKYKPDLIINLAANSLVSDCNDFPYNSLKNNCISALNILEYVRLNKNIKLINFTSDKVYQSKIKKHTESSNYGSNTIYGSSKVFSDLIASNYISLYGCKIINLRCGNLYGGGDFNPNRFFNDVFHNYHNNQNLMIRSINSSRPWTYILELINFVGILSNLFLNNKLNINFSGLNFSSNYKNYKIGDLLIILNKKIDLKWKSQKNLILEDKFLDINSSYIRNMINYKNVFNFNESLNQMIDWYAQFYNEKNILTKSHEQLNKIQ
tara:strand:+ start:3008 stop:4012 length:1005 start_codon:yes stop_codon:yes gene_type:complete